MYRSSTPPLGFTADGLSTEPWHAERDETLDATPAFRVVEAEINGGVGSGSP